MIGVLLAILLPALASVRRAAVSSLCKSRLSGIGRMYELYTGEHDGVLPTHAHPLDLQGVADPIFIENWSDGVEGWLILPINEISFWADLIRGYAASGAGGGAEQVIESLSCPVVYDRWRDRAETTRFDPMWSPQRSYVHSAGLFTRPSAWRDPGALPDVNKAHERFNVLAMDGHVERRAAHEPNTPAGFVGAVTGFEQPRVTSDEWREEGLAFVSTRGGAFGRDW